MQYIDPCYLSTFFSISSSSMKILVCRMRRSNLSGYCKQSRWFLHCYALHIQKQTGHSTCTYEKSGDSDPCTNMEEGTPWNACEGSVMIIAFSEGIFKVQLSSFKSPFLKRWDILCAYLALWLDFFPCVGKLTYPKLNDCINLY